MNEEQVLGFAAVAAIIITILVVAFGPYLVSL